MRTGRVRRFLCRRGGIEASITKILFITLALALVAIAIKLSYDALEAGRAGSNATNSIRTIGNLTAQLANQ